MVQDRKQFLMNKVMDFLNYLFLLCGLVVWVPGYRSRCPGFDSRLPHNLRSSESGTGSI
jgi:hypothetical protein